MLDETPGICNGEFAAAHSPENAKPSLRDVRRQINDANAVPSICNLVSL
jgi:hypothetical protein